MTTIVPFGALAPETLHRLAQEFVTRDGTDYGEHELSLEQKTQSILHQVRAGTVIIVFDEITETVNLFEKGNMPL